MVQTRTGAKNSEWLQFIRDMAVLYRQNRDAQKCNDAEPPPPPLSLETENLPNNDNDASELFTPSQPRMDLRPISGQRKKLKDPHRRRRVCSANVPTDVM